MKAIHKTQLLARRLYYSFPLQLLFLHLRSNFLLIFIWIFLLMTIDGSVGKSMGFNYLFLDPEYMGSVSFLGFYILGITIGIFIISWNMTTYILLSHRFPFLATLNRPYAKYSINNFFIPTLFIAYYLTNMVNFQWYSEFAHVEDIISYILGCLTGLLTTLMLSMIYFHLTNTDIDTLENKHNAKIKGIFNSLVVVNRRKQMTAKEDPYKEAVPIEIYLNEWFKPRLVRSVKHYNHKMLEKVFRQNHTNALVFQSFCIISLIFMSAYVEVEAFRIPAAGSAILLFSVFINAVGALTYWVQEWRTIAIILILAMINKMMGLGWFYVENSIYGLNYEGEPTPYNYTEVQKLASEENYKADMRETEKILQNWRSKFSSTSNPPLVIICSSGGGLRASLWSMQVMREADKILDGKLLNHTTLMTGASGGMLGAAYYRELYYQHLLDKSIDMQAPHHVENVGKDLANAITFTFVANDAFIPWRDVEVNGYTYKQDRGYVFEQQLIENSQGLLGQKLSYYKEPERQGLIPMMILSPVVINDGRFLLFSPQKLSYMMRPPYAEQMGNDASEIDAIDYGAMFANRNPYNARFVSGLRMSATYPYILPNAYLPTDPSVEIMDAGFRDNLGTSLATRFLSVFHKWIQKNVSNVIIIEIRGSEKITELPKGQTKSLANYFTVFNSIMDVNNLQDFHNDNYISALNDKIGNKKVHLLRFTYRPSLIESRASLSMHLTKQEKDDILNAIYLEENQRSLRQLKTLMRSRPIIQPNVAPIEAPRDSLLDTIPDENPSNILQQISN